MTKLERARLDSGDSLSRSLDRGRERLEDGASHPASWAHSPSSLEILILGSTLSSADRRAPAPAGAAPPARSRRAASTRISTSAASDEIGELAQAFTAMAAADRRSRNGPRTSAAPALRRLNEQLAHELEERERAERELARHRELNALLDTIDYGILFLERRPDNPPCQPGLQGDVDRSRPADRRGTPIRELIAHHSARHRNRTEMRTPSSSSTSKASGDVIEPPSRSRP